VAGALAVGGIFLFVVPVYDGPLGPVVRLLDKDPTHVHQKSRAFWLGWASRRFTVLDWWGLTRYLLPGGLYVNWPSRLARRVSPAIAVVARKGAAVPAGFAVPRQPA
jgi:hypothetical protein